MSPSVVDRLHDEMKDLIGMLEAAGEISLRSTADDNFRKTLLLASASYFESKLAENVLSFVRECSCGNSIVEAFVKNKAVTRQFHAWFSWDKKNANQFFGLFGKEFREYMEGIIRQDDVLDKSIQAFMEIGRDRNRLVHQDFASFSIEKTSDEIFALYQNAMGFVEAMPAAFREFCTLKANGVPSDPGGKEPQQEREPER